MVGFQGQEIDWIGEDGGWYVLLCELCIGVQLNGHLTAALAADSPDRQVITGVAIKYEGRHSAVVETEDPYSVKTESFPQDFDAPCLAEYALMITVDDEEHLPVPTGRAPLPEGAAFTTSNPLRGVGHMRARLFQRIPLSI